CFSLKYKFAIVFENFLERSFDFEPKKNVFLGFFDTIENIEILNIKQIHYNSQFNSIVHFEVEFSLANNNFDIDEKSQKYLISLSYSKKFGYRINETKKY
ncbi:MAG: hypothetical protein LBF97_01225, partial [Elusimicrobiota bacterium]|nr:hypothetical protein [Elusimicrobiota bacterium]